MAAPTFGELLDRRAPIERAEAGARAKATVPTERRFAYRDGDRLITGSLDRLVTIRDASGGAVAAEVADWKRDQVDPTDTARIDEFVAFYAPQLRAYRTAAGEPPRGGRAPARRAPSRWGEPGATQRRITSPVRARGAGFAPRRRARQSRAPSSTLRTCPRPRNQARPGVPGALRNHEPCRDFLSGVTSPDIARSLDQPSLAHGGYSSQPRSAGEPASSGSTPQGSGAGPGRAGAGPPVKSQLRR